MKGFLFDGTPEVAIASWIAMATLLIASLMLVSIVLLRIRALRLERRDARAKREWMSVFQHVLSGGEVPLQPLGHAELHGFIDAWNEVHEPLPEAVSRRLIPLGREVQLVAATRPLLHGKGYHDRTRAIIALGYMREERLFDGLSEFLSDRSPIVSLCAARALAQIDPPRAMAIFIPKIVERQDWSPANVARILVENHDGSAVRELSQVLPRVNVDIGVRLIRFLADIDPARAAETVREFLHANVDDRIISACLRIVSDPEDRNLVIGFLDSPRWHVRMHAAAALGRMGHSGDRQKLEPLLADPVWWVRYRAAQALLRLPDVGESGLQSIREGQPDSYGRDIIDQVLSEQSMRSAA